MSAVITPTPGRIVWFYPAAYDGIAMIGRDPLAAIIAGVHNDSLVNLAVFDAHGNMQQRSNVTLVQPDETAVTEGPMATWMPYQVGQAAKTEQLQAQITPLPVIDASALFAQADGTSASETGLVTDTNNDEPVDTESPSDESGAK